jgi:hypothetical protein
MAHSMPLVNTMAPEPPTELHTTHVMIRRLELSGTVMGLAVATEDDHTNRFEFRQCLRLPSTVYGLPKERMAADERTGCHRRKT